MSGPGEAAPATGGRLLEALLVLAVLAVLVFARFAIPELRGGAGTIASVGILLLGGTALANLMERVGLPHLTGYIVAGMVAGPHVLDLVDHQAVEELNPVNALALSLIALAGGAELRLATLKTGLGSLGWATLCQNLMVMVGLTVVFISARPLLPFLDGLPTPAVLGVGLIWGVMALTRSPAATLGILSQTRARGRLTTFTLNFIMTSDVVVVIALAITLTVARPLIEPGTELSLSALRQLGVEVLGSVSLGTTLGLLLIVYLRFIGRQTVLVLVALGLVFTQMVDYLHFDWLLIFITAGFLVQNLSRQGPKFIEAIDSMGEVVYVVFFGLAGAHLDLPLLGTLWPVALLFAASRGLLSWAAGRLSSRWADDPPAIRRWGWSGLVSQAGLALGIAAAVSKEFPAFGAGLGALALAAVAVNELVGPVLFKLALDRCGETRGNEEEVAEAREPVDA